MVPFVTHCLTQVEIIEVHRVHCLYFLCNHFPLSLSLKKRFIKNIRNCLFCLKVICLMLFHLIIVYVMMLKINLIIHHFFKELLIDISKHITVPYNSKPCKNWKCANQKDIDMYKTKLDNMLHYIDMPYELLQCNNVLCEIKGHVNCIYKLHDDIISACLYASDIIHETGKQSNIIPGWEVKLSHEREIALFWRSIWISMASPRDGVVAEIMRRTRAQYHYAIRKSKKCNSIKKKCHGQINY